MTSYEDPRLDPRTVEELINAALSEVDEHVADAAIAALHWKGTREVLHRAEALCKSLCVRERRLGALILGQLGVPDRTYPAECKSILRRMLQTEETPEVLRSVLIAISHQNDAEAIPQVIRHAGDADAEVRYAVVHALTGHEDARAIEALIVLSRDHEGYVRDWATFGLGTQLDLDTPEIREALFARLEDPDDDARGEAFVGLASRHDRRVVAALQKELTSKNVGTLAVEAAETIAAEELYGPLIALREWWDIDVELLESAIVACQREPGTCG